MKSNSGGKAVRYNKWGYIFLIPFIVVFVIFQLVPLVNTIYNSFFENYMSGLTQVGPTFVGLDNYKALFSGGDIWTYFKNTMVLWIMCFIPQIFLSLLLGAWFSDVRLKLKGSRFFKTVIYLPNLIMASAFSMLFFTLFSDGGPINSLLMQIGFISEPYKFLSHAGSVILKNTCVEVAPSTSAASKREVSIPIIPAIRRMVVLPNHIRQFISAIRPLALPVWDKNLYGSEINPICIKRELIGPASENSVKNNMENADAIIRFGR